MKNTGAHTIAAGLLMLGASALPAHATSGRTFVSGLGNDTGTTCARTAPCRSFQYAYNNTTPGGEIDVLDAAPYGAVAITHAISIVQDGAGEAVSPGGITINAGSGDAVHLRGLTVDGHGLAGTGISFTSGGSLSIINCVIRNFVSGKGIDMQPTSPMSFFIANTIVADIANTGILFAPATGSGAYQGVFDHVAAVNNTNGILVNGGNDPSAAINVTITHSVASKNSSTGIESMGGGGNSLTQVMVRDTASSNNGTGFQTQSGGVMRLAHSVATGNGTGVDTLGGGTLYSYKDNNLDGNAALGGALTTATQQ